MSFDQGFTALDSHGSILDLDKQDPDGASKVEIVTENDKANDKLVDLVSVLTNKINKNVKEIQVDLIDHYEEKSIRMSEQGRRTPKIEGWLGILPLRSACYL